MPQPNQVPKLQFPDMPSDFQQHYQQLIDTVNTLSGYNGTVQLSNHLDLSGNRVMNIGAPVEENDALSSGVAKGSYSAPVLGPQLESNGTAPLKTLRQINNGSQREQQSSFLNDLMSSVPSANGIFPVATTVGGGVQVVVPPSLFTFADGSSIMLMTRTDILSLPASFTITSITVTGNVVTVVTSTPTGLAAGGAMTISGVTPSQFNGSFTVTSIISATSFTYQDDIGTGSGSGGSVDLNNVYYYAVKKRSPMVHLLGPYSGDTAANRLNANYDGLQIVAVVVITSGGSLVASTGGGGSPIIGSATAGVFF